ncbi:MAG: hypothetical protein LIO60_02905, partial [Oscillospiraceae bacterium]|nr:hypothetical protein [Oscillospiraceae bacterium]
TGLLPVCVYLSQTMLFLCLLSPRSESRALPQERGGIVLDKVLTGIYNSLIAQMHPPVSICAAEQTNLSSFFRSGRFGWSFF